MEGQNSSSQNLDQNFINIKDIQELFDLLQIKTLRVWQFETTMKKQPIIMKFQTPKPKSIQLIHSLQTKKIYAALLTYQSKQSARKCYSTFKKNQQQQKLFIKPINLEIVLPKSNKNLINNLHKFKLILNEDQNLPPKQIQKAYKEKGVIYNVVKKYDSRAKFKGIFNVIFWGEPKEQALQTIIHKVDDRSYELKLIKKSQLNKEKKFTLMIIKKTIKYMNQQLNEFDEKKLLEKNKKAIPQVQNDKVLNEKLEFNIPEKQGTVQENIQSELQITQDTIIQEDFLKVKQKNAQEYSQNVLNEEILQGNQESANQDKLKKQPQFSKQKIIELEKIRTKEIEFFKESEKARIIRMIGKYLVDQVFIDIRERKMNIYLYVNKEHTSQAQEQLKKGIQQKIQYKFNRNDQRVIFARGLKIDITKNQICQAFYNVDPQFKVLNINLYGTRDEKFNNSKCADIFMEKQIHAKTILAIHIQEKNKLKHLFNNQVIYFNMKIDKWERQKMLKSQQNFHQKSKQLHTQGKKVKSLDQISKIKKNPPPPGFPGFQIYPQFPPPFQMMMGGMNTSFMMPGQLMKNSNIIPSEQTDQQAVRKFDEKYLKKQRAEFDKLKSADQKAILRNILGRKMDLNQRTQFMKWLQKHTQLQLADRICDSSSDQLLKQWNNYKNK